MAGAAFSRTECEPRRQRERRWNEARAFCAWLTEGVTPTENREVSSAKEKYRLPTDHEWSCAVGLGDREDSTDTPEDKNMRIEDVFPWGTWAGRRRLEREITAAKKRPAAKRGAGKKSWPAIATRSRKWRRWEAFRPIPGDSLISAAMCTSGAETVSNLPSRRSFCGEHRSSMTPAKTCWLPIGSRARPEIAPRVMGSASWSRMCPIRGAPQAIRKLKARISRGRGTPVDWQPLFAPPS